MFVIPCCFPYTPAASRPRIMLLLSCQRPRERTDIPDLLPDWDGMIGLGHNCKSRAYYRTNHDTAPPVIPRIRTEHRPCAPKFPYNNNIAIVEPPRQHSAAAASFKVSVLPLFPIIPFSFRFYQRHLLGGPR